METVIHTEEKNNTVESLNSMIRRSYVYASSVKNYMNNDPILDYYNRIKSTVRQDEMSQYMSDSCKRGVRHENRIYSNLLEFSKKYNLTYVDIEQYDYEEKYSRSMAALKDRADIIIQPMLVSHSYPVYGVADIVIKRKYLYLIDHRKRLPKELSVSCSMHCTETDHENDYCIVEIKRAVIHVDTDHNILNTNFQSFEGQAHVYAIALLDMLRILSIKYEGRCQSLYWPSTYIYVRAISGYSTYIYCPYIEVDHNRIHTKVIRAVAWIRATDRYTDMIMPGIHVLPNPHNKYDHPYRTAKLECAYQIGDTAYLPMSNIRVRSLLSTKGICSVYSKNCTLEQVVSAIETVNNTVLDEQTVTILQQILSVNQGTAATHLPRIYLPTGIVLYHNDKDYNFIIDGEHRKKIPYRSTYSIVYYYNDSQSPIPRLPSSYTLIDLRTILEDNLIAVPGVINYDLYFVMQALYSNGHISSMLTGDNYSDSYLLYELYQLLSSYC